MAFVNAVSYAFRSAALVSITAFGPSGDSGSDGTIRDAKGRVVYHDGKAHVQYPGSDPWVTSCGGATFSEVSDSSFTESTWNEGFGNTTGGGVSDFFELPSYQSCAGFPMSVNDGHQGRGVPDIAGFAGGYSLGSGSASISGTSAVAPFYAGLIAVINATLGKPIGYLNNTLYILGKQGGVFNDINDGASNASNGASGYTSGTGWGSINGQALLEALRVEKVRVHIDRILDHVPGTPEQLALVHTYARVKMYDPRNPRDDVYLTLVDDLGFEGFEKEFYLSRIVSIVIEIWRNTGQKVKHGTVETINGQRYIVFGPNEKYPVPADWDRLTPAEQAHFTTIIITPAVPAGYVERFTFTYDLRTHQFSGDATGSAGQHIHVAPPPHISINPPWDSLLS